jgi:hypothetical protein
MREENSHLGGKIHPQFRSEISAPFATSQQIGSYSPSVYGSKTGMSRRALKLVSSMVSVEVAARAFHKINTNVRSVQKLSALYSAHQVVAFQ